MRSVLRVQSMLLYRQNDEDVRYEIRKSFPIKRDLCWSECITNLDFQALYVGKHYDKVGQKFRGYTDSGFDFMRYGRNVITHMYEVWITISLL